MRYWPAPVTCLEVNKPMTRSWSIRGDFVVAEATLIAQQLVL